MAVDTQTMIKIELISCKKYNIIKKPIELFITFYKKTYTYNLFEQEADYRKLCLNLLQVLAWLFKSRLNVFC